MSTFDDFLVNHVASAKFIEEFEHVCYKVYASYKHYISFETFLDSCWDKLDERAKNFNPELGSSGNFIFSMLKNELIRLNSRHSRDTTSEIMDSLNEEENYVGNHHITQEFEYDFQIDEFCKLAFRRGLYIDHKQLFYQQDLLDYHPLIKVYQWFKINGTRKQIVGGQ